MSNHPPDHLRPVVVTWRDAWSDVAVDGTATEILAEGAKDCIRYTIGYMIGRSDKFLVLAADFDDRGKPVYQNVTAIPHGMVLKVTQCSFKSPSKRTPSPSKSLSSSSPLPSPASIISGNSSQPESFNDLNTRIAAENALLGS